MRIKDEIQKRLIETENKHNVHILYACESGSRIWGFDSKDSDFDVRFIYARSKSYYLSLQSLYHIQNFADTIENPVEEETKIDLCGWDLSKALFLLMKSNSPLIEWLNSPILYYVDKDFHKDMLSAMLYYYSRKKAIYHYLHMTTGNFNQYIGNRIDKNEDVWVKKYIYVLRTLLACLWIETYNTTIPLNTFELVNTLNIDSQVKTEIENLLVKKVEGEELSKGPSIPVLDAFITFEISRLKKLLIDNKEFNDTSERNLVKLNQILWKFSLEGESIEAV